MAAILEIIRMPWHSLYSADGKLIGKHAENMIEAFGQNYKLKKNDLLRAGIVN